MFGTFAGNIRFSKADNGAVLFCEMKDLSTAERLLEEGHIDEAIAALEELLASDNANERAYYILGNAHRKRGDWQKAINNYLSALEINPESPAKNALEIANDILSFYNKDMYNQ